ncbi:MAG: hypothetical protein ACT4P7_06460 [Gemmatimonadaceae bacterium]
MLRYVPTLLLIACGTLVAVEGEVVDTQNPAQILLESEGGIASLRVRVRLDSGTALLTREVCSLSASAEQCGERGNRQSVTIARAEVSRLFGYTMTAEFRALRADYGTSTQGADLMEHRITITANGRTRSVHGDDLTRPEPMAALMAELNKGLQSIVGSG